MKCPNCGNEIANDSVYCEYCGTKVETQKTQRINVAQPQAEYKRPNRFEQSGQEGQVNSATVGSEKQRHGFVTFWLWFMIVVNAVMTIVMIANSYGMTSIVAALLMAVNVVSAALLLNWKRIGFWLFCVTAVGSLIINISMESYQGVFGAILGVAILYGILNIKKDGVSCWSQLV